LDSERIRALIVGVSRYEALPDLAMVRTDAAALADVLVQPMVGAYRVRRLDSPRASVALAEITQQLRSTRRGDTLLIYFAGHRLRAGNELFLCARDTDPGDPWRTAIPVSRLRGEIDASKLRHVMVIVDSSSATVHADSSALDGLRGRTYTLLASTNSRPVQVVDAPGKTRASSAFTRALIDGLWRGEADYDNSGVVTLDELRDFVRQRMLAVSGGDPVVFMAAGPSNLRLAHAGRLTLLVHEDPSSAEVDATFRQIASQLDGAPSAAAARRSAWRAFADGFLSVFGAGREARGPGPSAWERLNGRLADRYQQMGNPPPSNPDDHSRTQP
jgi:hypothetical protein